MEADDNNNNESEIVSSSDENMQQEDEYIMYIKKCEDEKYLYEVLTGDNVVEHMNLSIQEISNIVPIPAIKTRILLFFYKWDKDKLLERYCDIDDLNKFFTEANLINPFNKPTTVHEEHVTGTGFEECELCFCEYQSNMMASLECCHRFCTECWNRHFESKIMEEGIGQSIACAGCDILVDDVTVLKLLINPEAKTKYQQLITNSFVECNRLLRWCPSPGCTFAIKVLHVEAKPVKCKCGHTFCFECGENWHEPLECRLFKKWIKKCDDDSETSNWIASNTKECPKCKTNIEKNDGCYHMTCNRTECRYNFCWVCLMPWKEHGTQWYSCANENTESVLTAEKDREKIKLLSDRYLKYFNRYNKHMQTLKQKDKLNEMIYGKMEKMQQYNMAWRQVQFLKKAADILCQCRQTLMCTYVFAYYLRKNNQSIIFKDNQRDLETATEKLSEYLERDITSENLADIKQQVQDKYRYCGKIRKNLIDHIQDGYEKEFWEYTE